MIKKIKIQLVNSKLIIWINLMSSSILKFYPQNQFPHLGNKENLYNPAFCQKLLIKMHRELVDSLKHHYLIICCLVVHNLQLSLFSFKDLVLIYPDQT